MNELVTSRKRTDRAAVDLVVVGAGIIGSSIAERAARSGMTVTVIDRNRTPGFGSTSSSAGIIRVHALDFESCVMADEAIGAWSRWREFLEAPASENVAEFVRCGSYIFDDDTDALTRMNGIMDAAGVSFDSLDGDALAAALPWADTRRFGPAALPTDPAFWSEPVGRIERATFTPSSGYVGDPALAAQNIAARAMRAGVRFELGRAVVGFTDGATGTIVVELDDGSMVEGAAVVNAAGPHSRLINALAGVGSDFGVTLSSRREELHLIHTPSAVSMARDGAHIVDTDLSINFRPDGDDAILVGGNGAAIDGSTLVDNPDDFRMSPSRDAWFRHASRLARRIPGTTIPTTPTGIAGLYDVTEDWLPIYDRTDRPGFFVAIGTSGNQFKTAPIVGDLMVAMIAAQLDGIDTDVAPPSVALPLTGRAIDMTVFSRRRIPETGGARG